MASPKFRLGGGGIQQKCTHKRLFEKFIKKFAQKFKNLQNFSKIKFNRIKENLKNIYDDLTKF